MSSVDGPKFARSGLAGAIERYFEVALYLLVLTGFLTLASTGGLDLPTMVLAGGAILIRGYCLARRQSLLIPERWTTLLTLGYAAFYLADYFVISRAFVSSAVHLVLFVLVVRLFSARRDRDRYFLAVIAFLMVLAAAVLTVDSTFLLALVAFLLTAVAAAILMEMRRASASAAFQPASDDTSLSRHMGAWLLRVTPAMVLLIALGAAVIFFLLPRASRVYLSAYTPTSEIATGFSDRVQLGRIGEIQQSTALVMHIQIDGDTHGAYDLKWRGVALSLFDGTTWSNPYEHLLVPRSPDGQFLLASTPAAQGGRLIHYRVLMEPVTDNVFFLAPEAISLGGNYRRVSRDEAGAVFNTDLEHPVSTYDAESDVAEPRPAELRGAGQDYPPAVLLNYLQLPRMDPRVASLAKQITVAESNDFDKAVAMERYLRTHFGYTLQLGRSAPRDPLAYFLFERKQGHCEYFASAMAVMLRSLRIPSRVVNGFRTGEFNDVTSQYLVRASNAHSWVEAYFPGYGWMSFDPTPAAPAQIRTGWGRWALYADAMTSFWREWVVSYDVRHQYILGRWATQSGTQWVGRLRHWERRQYDAWLDAARKAGRAVSEAPWRWSGIALGAAGLLALGAYSARLWRAFRRRQLAARPERSPRVAATIWYERVLQMLAKRGWQKLPAQTPTEFVAAFKDETMRDPLARFAEHYERARFGESAEDAARLPGDYKELAEASRR
ncbi:MAG: transglutaminase TgpA family protein [Terriglobales bacterium]